MRVLVIIAIFKIISLECQVSSLRAETMSNIKIPFSGKMKMEAIRIEIDWVSKYVCKRLF